MDRPLNDESPPETDHPGEAAADERRSPSRREILFVRAALAPVALFVIYDSMFGLRPGVSRGDHLSALLVPLALLTLLAAFWPKLAPGIRALSIGSIGVISLIGSQAVRGDGDQWSWLLLAAPGCVLLIAGVVLVFTHRRRGGHPIARRVAVGIGLLFWIWWVIVPLAVAVIATHQPTEQPTRYSIDSRQREVTITTRDGLKLVATYVPARNGTSVITYPTRAWTATESRVLAGAGFGVLALEMRGYGGSEGDVNRYGWGATPDIDAAVEYLKSKDEDLIGGLGISVGGEVLIDAAADDLDLLAVVSEGAGERSVRETMLFGPAAALTIPQAALRTGAVAVLSGDAPPPSLKSEIARISPRAVFLIDAENGHAGEQLNAQYFDAAGKQKRHWTVPGAEHTEGMATSPFRYAARIDGFFHEFLKPECRPKTVQPVQLN